MGNVNRSGIGIRPVLIGLCLLLHFALGIALFGRVWSAVSPFDGMPFDGPFQTYNALRRIDDGQRPGKDFVVFHGVGGPLLQYPYFKLLGGDIAASEISRVYLCRLQVVVVILLFSWFFQAGVCRSLLFWPMALGLDAPTYLAHSATNGLLEFRSLFPIIVAGFILAPREIRWRPLWIGISTAFALLCGVEQGMAVTVAGMGSAVAAAAISRHKPTAWKVLRETALGLSLGVALMLLVWFAIGGTAGVLACLKFYFAELPNDQFWYFGVPPNPIHDGSWANHRLYTAILVLSPICFFVNWWTFRRSQTEAESRLAIGLMTLCGYAGLASTSYLGIAAGINLCPSIRALVAALMSKAAAWTARFDAPAAEPDNSYTRTILFATLLIGPLVITPFARSNEQFGYSQACKDDLAVFTRVSGKAPGEAKTGLVWSDYAGAIEGELGIFNPHTDYIIHALGPERRASYLKKFEEVKPEYVVTAGPNFQFTPWLWQSFWQFYRQIFLDYDVVARTRYMHVWKRRPADPTTEKETAWIDATPLDDGAEFQIACPHTPGKVPLLEVKVSYSTSNPLGKLPVIGKLPRLFIYPSGTLTTLPVSLPPYQNEFVFPAFPAGPGPITLRSGVASITSSGTLKINSVQWRMLVLIDENAESILVSPAAKDQEPRADGLK
jgi:hypothetical protein